MKRTFKLWWNEEYGFFGEFYVKGDNSLEGFLTRKLSLAERTLEECDGILHLLNIQKQNKLLDIPCGYGRHSIELARRGLRITGADINPYHLKIAEKISIELGLHLPLIKCNMIEVGSIFQSEYFDFIINVFLSFGFFATDKENMNVLQQFYQLLKPGGKFLMHTDVNLNRLRAGKYQFNETRELVSGGSLKIREQYNSTTHRLNGSWIITEKSGKSATKKYSVRVYEAGEFINMCLKAGFRDCTAYGDWDGNLFKPNSEQIIFIAIK